MILLYVLNTKDAKGTKDITAKNAKSAKVFGTLKTLVDSFLDDENPLHALSEVDSVSMGVVLAISAHRDYGSRVRKKQLMYYTTHKSCFMDFDMTDSKNPINIFIIGSNGITIGDNSKVDQKFGEAIDISTWDSLKKLAFAYLSGRLDRLPYQVENGIEFIDIEAAWILDDRFEQLKKAIEESQVKADAAKDLLPTEINAMLNEWIAPITKNLEELSAKYTIFRNAFFSLQKRLENEGFPKEILIEGKNISVEGDDLLLIARTFINNDRQQEAIRIIKRYLSNNPDMEDANLLLIEALILTRSYDEVIQWVLDHDDLKKNLEIRMFLIVAYQQTGDFKSARNEFSLFSKEHPDSAQVIKLQRAMGY